MKTKQAHGYLFGLPYDFRSLSLAKIKSRMWNPEGSMWSPLPWGWGYTLNFAHRGTWVMLGLLSIDLVLTAIVLG